MAIRLTEKSLKKIIKESVRHAISEEFGSYKPVEDIVEYIRENNFEWKPCFKFKNIQVRKARPGEVVKTVLADGTEETESRVAEEGDFVVKNLAGPEQWIMKPNVLAKKYVETDKPGIFKPKGGPMLAAELQESIEFKPPMWGGDVQRIDAGGFLLMDPTNNQDVYGIARKEFFDTYKFGRA